MKIPFYQIDAFTSSLFSGNPAGVCLLDDWLENATMQAVAAENNLSETAFLVPRNEDYKIKWFTPKVEVDLCGHATLASAFVIFNYVDKSRDTVCFDSASGPLTVKRNKDSLSMDFPSDKLLPCPAPNELLDGLHIEPDEVLLSRDYLVVYDSEDKIKSLRPDMEKLSQLDRRGIIATAPGSQCDFVSRFFAPSVGIPEDPVTGSAHCTLVPYWANKTGKTQFHALQLSQRGGELFCKQMGDRVAIAGKAVAYLEGTIIIND